MAAMHLHLDKLIELDRLKQIFQRDVDLAEDIVPALNENGAHRRREEMFRCRVQEFERRSSRANPTDPEAKNNLAWLCAPL